MAKRDQAKRDYILAAIAAGDDIRTIATNLHITKQRVYELIRSMGFKLVKSYHVAPRPR